MRVTNAKFRSIVILSIALLLLVSMLGVYGFAKCATPGKLVAKEPLLTWQSPVDGPFRFLALDAAQATFRLENVGGSPVRILDVRTTCGCTTPKIDLMLVAPGKIATVEARATPLQIGDKYVDITMLTDSPSLPIVVVQLHIIGSRKAPYMTDARGDLNFSGDVNEGEIQLIVVNCVEKAGSRPIPPIVKNELAFIGLSAPILEKEQKTTAPEAVNRKWIIEARLSSTSAGNDYGQIMIIDPWDPDHFQPIRVHREVSPPLRVSPQRAILTAERGGDAAHPTAKFMITSKEPIADLVVELEETHAVPLSLSKPAPGVDNRRFFFSVTLDHPVKLEAVYHVRIGRVSSTDRIRVPIAIRGEASQ